MSMSKKHFIKLADIIVSAKKEVKSGHLENMNQLNAFYQASIEQFCKGENNNFRFDTFSEYINKKIQ